MDCSTETIVKNYIEMFEPLLDVFEEENLHQRDFIKYVTKIFFSPITNMIGVSIKEYDRNVNAELRSFLRVLYSQVNDHILKFSEDDEEFAKIKDVPQVVVTEEYHVWLEKHIEKFLKDYFALIENRTENQLEYAIDMLLQKLPVIMIRLIAKFADSYNTAITTAIGMYFKFLYIQMKLARSKSNFSHPIQEKIYKTLHNEEYKSKGNAFFKQLDICGVHFDELYSRVRSETMVSAMRGIRSGEEEVI